MVTDSNSVLRTTKDLNVGVGGNAAVASDASFTINGGSVSDHNATLGGAGGTAVVSIKGGLWSNWGGVTIGGGTLTISGGNLVDDNANITGTIDPFGPQFSKASVAVSGGNWSNTETLSVGGAPAAWRNNNSSGQLAINAGSVYAGSALYVGNAGNGTLTMSGGALSDSNAIIGNLSTLESGVYEISRSTGYVSVSGGLWSNSGTVTIGNEANGELTISGSGTIIANGVTIAVKGTTTPYYTIPGAVGILNFGAIDGSDNSGTLITPTISFGNGNGAINFNQTNLLILASAIVNNVSAGQNSLYYYNQPTNGSVNQLGSGTTVLTGNNTYSSTTTISNGTLQVGDGSTNGSFGRGAIVNNSSLIFNSAGTLTIMGKISGSGNISQLGSGATILTGNNSFSGTTTINQGMLVAASTNAFGSSAVHLNGGTLSVQPNTGSSIFTPYSSSISISIGGNNNGLGYPWWGNPTPAPLTITSLIWNSDATISLANPLFYYLNVSGEVSLTGSASHDFNLTGFTLTTTPTELFSFGTNALTANGFGITGLTGVFTNYSLSVSNDALWISEADLYVGSNSSGQTTNITSGANIYGSTFVGYGTNASSNTLIVSGSNTLLTNAANLTIGAGSGRNNLLITNGARVVDVNGSVDALLPNGSNNFVIVTGRGSTWSNSGNLTLGVSASGNSITISDGGGVINSNGCIGSGGISIGGPGAWYINGGDGANLSGGNSNSGLVTGVSSYWINNGILTIGSGGSSTGGGGGVYAGNGGNVSGGNGNSLTVSNGASIQSLSGTIGDGGTSDGGRGGNTVGVSGGYSGNGGSASGGNSNLVVVTGFEAKWSNCGTLTIGFGGSSMGGNNSDSYYFPDGAGGNVSGGNNNSLLVTNGGSVASYNGYVGNGGSSTGGSVSGGNSNVVFVTGAGSTWSNGGMLTIGYGGDSFGGGYSGGVNGGNANTLVIASGGVVISSGCTIGNGGDSTDGGDYYGRGGNVSGGNSNVVFVTGVGALWSNSGQLTIGLGGSSDTSGFFYTGGIVSGGNSNALVISNGGNVVSSGALIGNGGSSIGGSGFAFNGDPEYGLGVVTGGQGNAAVVTGAGSLWSNNGTITLGMSNGSGTLTVANGGTVNSVGGITLGDGTASVGTLNIGSFGGSDTAGIIITPSIVFGSGTGTINFNQVDTTTISSEISGNGTVQQLGKGLTILTGNNSYTGTTTVNGGALLASSTNALGTSRVTLNGGTLVVNTLLTINSLNWVGTNALITINNPGTNYLRVTNSVTLDGGTNYFSLTDYTLSTIPSELLFYGTNGLNASQFGIASLGGYSLSGYLLFTSNNALWIQQSGLVAYTSTTTVNGTASYNSASFQSNGILNITPTGNLTITTDVNVTNNGTVNLNGTLTTPSLTVFLNSVLGGSGTLNGNLTNSGLVSPGNSPGTLTVNGNFTQTQTGSLLIQVASGTVFDQVIVHGKALLGGTLIVTPYNGYQFAFGQKFGFLTADSIKGSYSSVEAPQGYRARVTIVGDPVAYINIAPASYTQLAASPNQLQVAKALDSFIPATNGDQLVVSTTLDSLTASQYQAAFNSIMPSLYQSMSTTAFNLANAQNQELLQRLWGVRLAGTGFSMSGFADNTPVIEGQGDGGKGVLDAKKDILRPGLDNHWGMFVDGNGIFAVANSGNMLPNYNSQSGGITTGLTYKWNESFGTGIYAGYEGSYNKYAANAGYGNGSTLINNSVRFGLFGTYGNPNGKGFYADGLIGGGYNNYQISRAIAFSGLSRTANSTPGAGELDSMLAGGYDLKKGNWTYGPTTSLQYTYFGANAVNETGAQSLDFNSGGWQTSSLLYSLGAHAAYSWQANKDIMVVPQVSLSWQHEFLQSPYSINGSLGGSPTFSNTSATPLRDTLYTGVGFTVEFYKKWNTSLFYNASAGNKNLTSENIFWSAGVKF